MSTDTFARLIPSFSSTDLVFLQGWGEPLLHPALWDMARAIREAGARVGFTTNGLLLDRKHREALLESGVEILGVSLAGATPPTHDRFRGGCPFETVNRNLLALKEEKETRGVVLPKVHLAYLLLKDNAEELPRAVELAARWGGRQVIASHLSLVLDHESEEQSLSPRSTTERNATSASQRQATADSQRQATADSQRHATADSQRQAMSEADVRAMTEAEVRAKALGILFRAYQAQSREAASTCRENVLRSCFVSARGDVSPCVMCNVGLREGAEVSHRFQGRSLPVETLLFGNVRERSLEEIWWDEPARRFRETFRGRVWRGTRGQHGLPSPCTHCYKIYEW